jgi:alpha-beta hydrolase superfamily lysophospholipase
LLTAIACTGLAIFIFHIGPRMILQPRRITVQQLSERYPDGFTPDAYGLRADVFDVQAEPDVLLCGWFVRARTDPPVGTVILLHGIGGCKEKLLGLAKNLAASGFNCLLYDSRAQGRSGGRHCTFGYYEKRDVSACMDEVQRRYGHDTAPFAVFGNSFGGAVALQAMAIDKRICCGVVESTFATLREVTYDYMLYYGGIGLRFVSNAALWRAGRVAVFDPDDVQPEIAARQITQPILLAHGEKDECISIEYGRRIFANLASQDKAWFPVPNAGHDEFADVAGEEHQQRIVTFLRKHMMARLAAEFQR